MSIGYLFVAAEPCNLRVSESVGDEHTAEIRFNIGERKNFCLF